MGSSGQRGECTSSAEANRLGGGERWGAQQPQPQQQQQLQQPVSQPQQQQEQLNLPQRSWGKGAQKGSEKGAQGTEAIRKAMAAPPKVDKEEEKKKEEIEVKPISAAEFPSLGAAKPKAKKGAKSEK